MAIPENYLSLSQFTRAITSCLVPCPKRGQDTSNDGSPTAKGRPVGLVMHYPGKEKFSSQSSGTLVNLENDDLNKRAQHAVGSCGGFDSKFETRGG